MSDDLLPSELPRSPNVVTLAQHRANVAPTNVFFVFARHRGDQQNTINQCLFHVGSPSATLAQHNTNVSAMLCFPCELRVCTNDLVTM